MEVKILLIVLVVVVGIASYRLIRYWIPKLEKEKKARSIPPPPADHKKLPPTRKGIDRKTVIGTTTIYLITGEYDDGSIGEIFIKIDKEGEAMRVYDCFAIVLSLGLQHGVPLELFVEKLKHQSMEPSGVTSDPEIPICKSITDYIIRKLENRHLKGKKRKHVKPKRS